MPQKETVKNEKINTEKIGLRQSVCEVGKELNRKENTLNIFKKI